MAKKTLGVATGQPTKKGTWGGSYQIEKKHSPKKVSCYMCVHCGEKGSCRKHGTFIPLIGASMWRNCNSFLLSLSYCNKTNISFVNRIKGLGFIQQEVVQSKNVNKPIAPLKQKEMKRKTNPSLENYFQKYNVSDIDINMINRKLHCFDDSKIRIHKFIIPNICLICLDRLLNPETIINKSEDELAKYIYNNPSFTDEIQQIKLLVKIIAVNIGCSLNEILVTNNKNLFDNFLNNEYILSGSGYLNDGQYYLANPDYVQAQKDMKKGILNYYNEEMGVMIDLEPVKEWLPIYSEDIENIVKNEHVFKLYFFKMGNSYYKQKIIAGQYLIGLDKEIYE